MSIEISSIPQSYNVDHSGNKQHKIPIVNDNPKPEQESPLAEAIRLYQNSILKGERELTSEEKKEIQGLIKDYIEKSGFLDKYNKNTVAKKDYVALNNFVKGLYRKFGSKSDYYDFAGGFIDDSIKSVIDPANKPDPPFKLDIPSEHASDRLKKPKLAPFHAISAHKFLMQDESERVSESEGENGNGDSKSI